MTTIHKAQADWRVRPNFSDYERTRANFDWSVLPNLCAGMGPGHCNIGYAAVDRHAAGERSHVTALRFVGKAGWDGVVATRDLTYAELGRLTRKFTNVLRSLGVNSGDRVFTLMGRSPELYITILGALRNGSVVSPLFAAFGPEPIATRMSIADPIVLVTTKEIFKRRIHPIRESLRSLRYIFVVDGDRRHDDPPGTLNFWQWMDAAGDDATVHPTTAEDEALLHFTSGTTGTPKAAVHVHGAVAMHFITRLYALDLHPDDIFWCTADPGWVTGTSYGVIAPLLHGVTSIVDEGDFDADRWYRILQALNVTVWYTAPTAIRMLIKAGPELAHSYQFPRLRFVASVGEPLGHARKRLGAAVAPKELEFVDTLPHTRSGKIMRRLLKARELGLPEGDLSTVEPGYHKTEGVSS